MEHHPPVHVIKIIIKKEDKNKQTKINSSNSKDQESTLTTGRKKHTKGRQKLL